MKKAYTRGIARMVCIVILILVTGTSTSVIKSTHVHASEAIEANPKYECAFEVKTIFEIDADGMARMSNSVVPLEKNKPDKIMIKMMISKIDGTMVYNQTHQAKWNELTGRFEVNKIFQLNRRGNYQLRTTIYCYKSGKLLETIQCAAKKQTY